MTERLIGERSESDLDPPSISDSVYIRLDYAIGSEIHFVELSPGWKTSGRWLVSVDGQVAVNLDHVVLFRTVEASQ